MNIHIKLGEERARQLNDQIARDVAWLTKLNIMDYSLLLGIHYKDRAGDIYGGDAHKAASSVATGGGDAHPAHVGGDHREGLAGGVEGAEAGEFATLRPGAWDVPPEEEHTHLDQDGGGIYTQLHPRRTGAAAPNGETSHLEPHSINAVGIGLHDIMHTPIHRGGFNANHTRSPITIAINDHPQQSHSPILTYPATTNNAGTHSPAAAANITVEELNVLPDPDEEDAMPVFHDDNNGVSIAGIDADVPFTPARVGVATAAATPPGSSVDSGGPFSTKTWSAAGPASAPRSTRSQSLLPLTGSSAAAATSPTEAAARTKKELAAAAKLDAIAKQTAYGLPKKYNTVSKPGDIAFPFEFDENGLAVGFQSGPISPGKSVPSSPLALGQVGPTNNGVCLSPPIKGKATADNTPMMRSFGTAGTGTGDAPPHPPTLELQSSTSTGVTQPESVCQTPVATPRQPRSMSVFASPNSKEALGFFATQRDRGVSGPITPYQRSILQSPVASAVPHATATTPTHADTASVVVTRVIDSSPPRTEAAPVEATTATATETSPNSTEVDPPHQSVSIHLAPDEHKSTLSQRPSHSAGGATAAAAVASSSSSSSALSALELSHNRSTLDLFGTDGGCAGQNPDGSPNNEIYFLGIIDILQTWNLAKKSERLAKVYLLNNKSNEISAAPPPEYAERFKEFIKAACVDAIENLPNKENN